MNKKMLLITVLTLFMLTVLNVDMGGVSASPSSPYLAVVPSSSRVMLGYNLTVSVDTDYAGGDVWGWDVRLTFNAAVLHCIQVANGDLITTIKDPSAEFRWTINNAAGFVDAGADFYYDVPPPPVTTSGPGTLVRVTFLAMSTGDSAITLEKPYTKLLVYDPEINLIEPVVKIGADTHPNQIGHGTIRATILGDANGDKNVNSLDIGTLNAHWSPASGTPPWSLGYDKEVDCNNDGYINSLDIGIVNAHWGQSW